CFAHVLDTSEVVLGREIKRRYRPDRLGETPGDRLSNLCKSEVLEVAFARGLRRTRSSSRLHTRGGRGFDVASDDTSARPAATELTQIQPLLAGESAGQGRRADPATVALWLLRGRGGNSASVGRGRRCRAGGLLLRWRRGLTL